MKIKRKKKIREGEKRCGRIKKEGAEGGRRKFKGRKSAIWEDAKQKELYCCKMKEEAS